MLYQINTIMRLVGFLSRGIVFLAIGFVLGVLYNEGKVHFPKLSLVPVAYAEVTFDPAPPQDTGTDVNVSCSVGDYVAMFKPDGSLYANVPCPNNITPSDPGNYIFSECDSTVEFSSCDSTYGDISQANSDPGYISQQEFEFTATDTGDTDSTSTATTTSNTQPIGYWDFMFVSGVIIFLLSYPVWVRIFNL